MSNWMYTPLGRGIDANRLDTNLSKEFLPKEISPLNVHYRTLDNIYNTATLKTLLENCGLSHKPVLALDIAQQPDFARVLEIQRLSQPQTQHEFFHYSRSCLAEISTIVRNYADIIDLATKQDLEKLNRICAELEQMSVSNSAPPPPSDDKKSKNLTTSEDNKKWYQKLKEAIMNFVKTVIKLLKKVAQLIVATAKTAIVAVKAMIISAWEAFWSGVGAGVIEILFGS